MDSMRFVLRCQSSGKGYFTEFVSYLGSTRNPKYAKPIGFASELNVANITAPLALLVGCVSDATAILNPQAVKYYVCACVLSVFTPK
jgi:hypothetical protein